MPRGSLSKELLGSFFLVDCSIACNPAFRQRTIDAANPRRFARAKNIRDGRRLPAVDAHKSIFQFATERQRQFDVGYQMEAAGEKIAFLGPGLSAIRQRDA